MIAVPLTPAALNAEWSRPTGPFWTPKLAGRATPCLELRRCSHARCNWLRVVVLQPCSLCGRRIGWGVKVHPDPQGSLFGPSWVHGACIAPRTGFQMLRTARAQVAALHRRGK